MTDEQAILILDNIAIKRTESECEKQAVLKAIRCMEKDMIMREKAIELLKALVLD